MIVSIGNDLPVYRGEIYLDEAPSEFWFWTLKEPEIINYDNCSTSTTTAFRLIQVASYRYICRHQQPGNITSVETNSDAFYLIIKWCFRWTIHAEVRASTFLEHCFKHLENNLRAGIALARMQEIGLGGRPVCEYAETLNSRRRNTSQKARGILCNAPNRSCFVFIVGLMRTGIALRQRTVHLGLLLQFLRRDWRIFGSAIKHTLFAHARLSGLTS